MPARPSSGAVSGTVGLTSTSHSRSAAATSARISSRTASASACTRVPASERPCRSRLAASSPSGPWAACSSSTGSASTQVTVT